MTLPNFIGIGAQRAATTWMYHCLREHPEIFTSEKKEIHFFDENFEKGIDWYKTHFDGATESVVAEVTPNYLNAASALERMADCIPDARLFVVLREPVSRAYSSYRLLYNEHFQNKSFEEACAMSPYMIKLSRYADDLRRAYSLFGKDRVAVYLYDDILSHPEEIVSQLYAFAGVDAEFVPESINTRYNPVLFSTTQNLLIKLRLGTLLEKFKRTRLGVNLKNRLTAKKMRHDDRKSMDSTKRRIASPEFIAQLKKEFRDDILEVQDLIDRDLSAWL